jgi:TrmH family RNA methyltransferase
VVACDVQDPGNLGAMIRVAEGSGATGFIAAGECADVYGWKAMRGSMGSALRLPIAIERDAMRALGAARAHGCRVLATVPRGGVEFFKADLRRPVALLLGGEGRGLTPELIDDADERVTIPMTPPVESLNVAVATALITYEARRQRG